MKHLTEHELSAHLDQALDPSERRRVDAHLETCAGCRASLAELAAQDRGVASALAHDPGDAYFESFAARVEDRIRAQGLAGAQAHPERFEGPWRWLKSPRALAWAG
ncbi:MAG TPA: zf-HC2 domain-containing protein, partial [Candidatus Udaeobacter sp.]|nr:zf-HC2 domain-containing protein [Candidatus Udaeobacter sp.]